MTQGTGPSAPTRTTSLTNFGLVLIGAAILIVAYKFGGLALHSSSSLKHGFLTIGIALLVWGGRRIFWFLAFGEDSGSKRPIVRDRIVFLREGMVYLLIMLVAMIGSLLGRSNMLMFVSAMMAGPFVINGWVVFRMLRRVQLVRNVPLRAQVGQPVTVGVEIHNRKWLMSSHLMHVQDIISGDSEQLSGGVLFVRVPPRSSRRGWYKIRFGQRGLYRFGPLSVSSRFPLGIGERGRVFPLRDEILVHPAVGRLSSNWKQEMMTATELVERQSGHRGVFDDEFHRIREFRYGDNPRAIHWRTTARHNELMIREFQQNRDHDLAVLVHLWLPARPDEAQRDQIELAVSFAATLCIDHVRSTRDSDLTVGMAGLNRHFQRGAASAGSAEDALDHLAVANGSVDADLSGILQQYLDTRSRSTRVVLVSTNPSIVHALVDTLLSEDGQSDETVHALRELSVVHADADELSEWFSPAAGS